MSRNLRLPFYWLALLAVLVSPGCSKQSPVAPGTEPGAQDANPRIETAELDRLDRMAAGVDGGATSVQPRARRVFVPAGSVNALAAALSQAGEGGVVVLRTGVHTENATVRVDQRVTLIGESGAILVSGAGVPDGTVPYPIAPALHVVAGGTTIWGLAIQPAGGDGNTGVLVDNAADVTVYRNRITSFQFGVLVESSDRARVWSNIIATTSVWQTGAVGDAHGIVVINGVETSVLRNEVSNSVFGIWVCDARGTLAYNTSRNSYVGIILCNVPLGTLKMPGGQVVGAHLTATQWTVGFNQTLDNLTTGLLVIDGAKENLISSNKSTGNGAYDVELTGDSYRFGFLTPASVGNTFVAGLYPNTEVKNCGNGNVIIGGQLVDNTVEPCD